MGSYPIGNGSKRVGGVWEATPPTPPASPEWANAQGVHNTRCHAGFHSTDIESWIIQMSGKLRDQQCQIDGETQKTQKTESISGISEQNLRGNPKNPKNPKF